MILLTDVSNTIKTLWRKFPFINTLKFEVSVQFSKMSQYCILITTLPITIIACYQLFDLCNI